MKKLHLTILFSIGLLASGCSKSSGGEAQHAAPRTKAAAAQADEKTDSHEGHDHEGGEHEGHGREGHDHEGHGHGGTDLDRPVEELFAARCEHRMPASECDECRYEVGVVKAPKVLFDEGLLKSHIVGERPLETAVELTGEIGFDEKRIAHVSSQVEGIIRKVHVNLGQTVEKGAPLAEIYSVAFAEAAGEYREAQASLTLARREHERQASLRKEGITSEKEYLQASQGLESAQIRLETAADKLVRLGLPRAELDAVREGRREATLTLRAPVSGVVLKLHAVAGEIARSEEPLATVGDLSRLWLWADLYENDLARVAESQARGHLSAAVAVNAFPGREFAGVVDFIGPTMDPATRTVKVRVLVENPEGGLRAGMFAKAKLFVPTDAKVVAVPRGAVLQDEGRSFVFVRHRDDYFVRRPVTTGRAWSGWLEIVEGLGTGKEIAADGAFLLKSDVLRSKMGAGCAD
ncbi:MAG: efflux RND transporter periplasmic adaptor subunit [Myxococcales bacterium]|jgi:cobalt-zinc-cadmium efflux system membrane fusion protein